MIRLLLQMRRRLIHLSSLSLLLSSLSILFNFTFLLVAQDQVVPYGVSTPLQGFYSGTEFSKIFL